MKLSVLSAVLIMSACHGGLRNQSTVSVVGTGTVMAQPDMVQMNISLSNTAPTTGAAQREVNKMVGQAMEVLKGFGIEDKSITTASLTFSPQYDFSSGRRSLIGQNAQQTIAFSVDDIQNNAGRLSDIIDRLVQINGIELDRMNFSVRDDTGYFTEARELAFRKAAEKAKQFAELSGLKVGRVVSISEEGSPQIMPVSNRFIARSAAFMDEAAGSPTILPSGEQEITTRISAVFLLE